MNTRSDNKSVHSLRKKRPTGPSRVVLSEAVDWCDFFIPKNQHGSDWERCRPQGRKNVHTFLRTVRPVSWACGHETEMLLILKNTFDLIIRGQVLDMTVKELSHDFIRGQSVAETGFHATLDRWSPGAPYVPVSTIYKHNVGLMLGQRLRRWPNIKQTLVQCIMGRCVALCGVVFFTPCNVRDPSQPEIPQLWSTLQIK